MRSLALVAILAVTASSSSSKAQVTTMHPSMLARHGACFPLKSDWTPHFNNLRAYWPMDNDWNDHSGNSGHGTGAAGMSFAAGAKVGSHAMNIVSGWGMTTTAVMPATYTKSAWIYLTDPASHNNVISGNSGDSQHALWMNGGCGHGKLAAGHNGVWDLVCDSLVLSMNKWYHVALTYDAATLEMKLYRDGELVDTETSVANFAGGGTGVGVGQFDANPSWAFVGRIDEAAIWNRVLTHAEIKLIHSQQRCGLK